MWQNILEHCAVFTKVSEEFAPHYLAEIRHDMRQTTTQTEQRPAATAQAGFKLKDACGYVGGISEISMRRLINRGVIKTNRQLRHIIISRAELDRFLAEAD
jgi:hypothetical protein